MNESSFDAVVSAEWARIRRLAEANPGVAYLGDVTGQLAVHLDPAVDDVVRASITATTLPPVPRETAPYYHATVSRPTSAENRQVREVFRHPFPALDWITETVPDFDLLPTERVGTSADGEPAGD